MKLHVIEWNQMELHGIEWNYMLSKWNFIQLHIIPFNYMQGWKYSGVGHFIESTPWPNLLPMKSQTVFSPNGMWFFWFHFDVLRKRFFIFGKF